MAEAVAGGNGVGIDVAVAAAWEALERTLHGLSLVSVVGDVVDCNWFWASAAGIIVATGEDTVASAEEWGCLWTA